MHFWDCSKRSAEAGGDSLVERAPQRVDQHARASPLRVDHAQPLAQLAALAPE